MNGTPEEITATIRRLLDYYDGDVGVAVTALVCGGERRASMRRHPSAACPPPYDQDTDPNRIATVLDFRARKPDVSSHLEDG